MDSYDVVVIGGGPGGYVAAIRCAQLGLSVACVDAWRGKDSKPALGGTCLNVGCIPSKALLDSTHHYHRLQHEFIAHGISASGVKLDLKTMMSRKDEVVRTLTGGVALLFSKHKITWLQGHGRLLEGNGIEVSTPPAATASQVVKAKHIIIATGSISAASAVAPYDGDRIVDSSGALEFDEIPKRFGVIGGGAVGLELGSVWSRLGAEVTILNRGEQFLSKIDEEIAKAAYAQLTAQGLSIRLGAQVKSVRKNKKQVTVVYTDGEGEHKLTVDRLLVATGRKPHTAGLGAKERGLALDDSGFIVVDERCRTNLPGVYAIGDVVRGPMLAHKASEEGIAVAEHIAGQASHVNYDTIPGVIYTAPEIAWVGKTTQALRDSGADYRVGVFPFAASGRAHAMGETAGMVKIISDARSDRVLGAHILGPSASEMISEAVTVMEYGGSAEDIARTTHAHPTLSEAFREAALAVDRRTLHR